MKRFLLAFGLFSFFCSCGFSEDWPQWRGLHRDGKSPETNLLETWPEGGPPLVWLYKNAGPGYGGPAIVGDRMYILVGRKGKTRLVAIDNKQGTDIWEAEIGDIFRNDWGDGDRSTPTVDGDRIYALGAQGDLVCVHAKDGSVVWKKSLIDDLGGEIPFWGYSESVLIDGDHVICTPGGDRGTIAALNKLTGEVVWQTEELTEGAHYASVVHANFTPAPHLVQLTSENVVGISKTDGKVLWSVPWPGRIAVIPTPVVSENRVFATSGYGSGCKLVELSGNASAVQANEVYASKKMKNHHGGVVLVNGHVYGYSDEVGWLCLDLQSGEELWSNNEKLGKGAVTYADGHLYCLGESSGDVVLVEASPEGWKESGRFTLNPQSTHRKRQGAIWTHPVISQGRLYLRDQDLIYCFDLAGKS